MDTRSTKRSSLQSRRDSASKRTTRAPDIIGPGPCSFCTRGDLFRRVATIQNGADPSAGTTDYELCMAGRTRALPCERCIMCSVDGKRHTDSELCKVKVSWAGQHHVLVCADKLKCHAEGEECAGELMGIMDSNRNCTLACEIHRQLCPSCRFERPLTGRSWESGIQYRVGCSWTGEWSDGLSAICPESADYWRGRKDNEERLRRERVKTCQKEMEDFMKLK